MRILLVDDSEDVRFMLRLAIEGTLGWEVVGEAANGQVAYEAAFELKPDLVILDIDMPVMGGFQAALIIRWVAPEVRILFYTAFDNPDVRRCAKEVGADGYISKSTTIAGLKKEVERLSSSAA